MQKSTETTNYFSLPQKYTGNKNYDLELIISRSGDDALEIELIDLHYHQKRNKKLKQLAFAIITHLLYVQFLEIHTYTILLLGVPMLILIVSILNLIKSIKLMYFDGIALQLETHRFIAKDVYCISTSNIYDIVINEVIERLDIHYLLILRTKGSLFKKKPIIPLFNDLKPSVECLNVIYKNIRSVMSVKNDYIKTC